jgi:hypothetical protein
MFFLRSLPGSLSSALSNIRRDRSQSLFSKAHLGDVQWSKVAILSVHPVSGSALKKRSSPIRRRCLQAPQRTPFAIQYDSGTVILVIISAWLSEWDRGRILSAAGKTSTYVLRELTLASELLGQVERLLPDSRL